MARLRGKTVFLGDVAQNRDNNLNLLRFLAAATVALSHSFLLVTGDPESRPLMKATGFSIGYHAVDIFFVISGFLVTQSWMRRSSLLDFTVARALRIYPALAVCVMLTALVLLPPLSNTSAAGYFSSFETFSYVILTASLVSPDGTLPGTFLTTPVANEVNGSLWTLRYEVLCYAALAFLGMSGILARRKWLIRTAFVIGLPLAALSLFPIAYADAAVASTACAMAISATSVFPDPTSPCSRRSIFCGDFRSCKRKIVPREGESPLHTHAAVTRLRRARAAPCPALPPSAAPPAPPRGCPGSRRRDRSTG